MYGVGIESRMIAGPDGFVFEVRLVHDEDANPYEADCYTEEDIAAWQRGDWSYVAVIVSLEGMRETEASVWGVEYGQLGVVTCDMDNIIEGFFDDLKAEVLDRAKTLRDRLNTLLTAP